MMEFIGLTYQAATSLEEGRVEVCSTWRSVFGHWADQLANTINKVFSAAL